MRNVELNFKHHEFKVGGFCPDLTPNVFDDSIFYLDGKAVGFFIKKLPEKALKLATLANQELRSNRVPKSEMKRSSGLHSKENEVLQYSTIIGSVPPKVHMRRPYKSISSVHGVHTAKNFIKAMYLLSVECESIIKSLTPEIYNKQIDLFKSVDDCWKIGQLFTSSISNYNISAPYHRDTANIEGCVNVIITKRNFAKGGNLHVPDFDLVFDQTDNSMLVYPAYLSLHAVTPIKPTSKDGYRNSLVFYPLKAFLNTKQDPNVKE